MKTAAEFLKEKYPHWFGDGVTETLRTYLTGGDILKMMEEYANQSKWITDRTPPLIEGEIYSENVLAETEQHTQLQVMCYCYNPSEDETGGYFWATCNGDIHGDAEFDDDYTVIKWQPIPKI